MRNRKHPLNEMRDCPECGRRLKWSGDVAVCKCGAKITFKTPNAAGQGRREATYPEPACSQGGCQ